MHPSLTIHWTQPKLFFIWLTLGSARACVLRGSAHNFAAGLEDKVSAVPAMGAGWGLSTTSPQSRAAHARAAREGSLACPTGSMPPCS